MTSQNKRAQKSQAVDEIHGNVKNLHTLDKFCCVDVILAVVIKNNRF